VTQQAVPVLVGALAVGQSPVFRAWRPHPQAARLLSSVEVSMAFLKRLCAALLLSGVVLGCGGGEDRSKPSPPPKDTPLPQVTGGGTDAKAGGKDTVVKPPPPPPPPPPPKQ